MEPLDNLGDIQSVATRLLRRAAVAETLPTPVEDIVAAAGLIESDEFLLTDTLIAKAPRELRRLLRSARRKINGALDRDERVIFVKSDQTPAKQQFVRCHETMHDALPWQRKLLVLADTQQTLAPSVRLRFEREANQGGAELLFQGKFLDKVARDYPLEIGTPVRLGELFGASTHATFRRFIEGHRAPVCGVVLGGDPMSVMPLTYQRFELIESTAWSQRFGRAAFPKAMSAERFGFLAALLDPFAPTLDSGCAVDDIDGTPVSVRVQSFNNTYNHFLLFWVPSKQTFIARHRGRTRVLAS